MDDAAELLRALGTLAWPVLVAFVAWRLSPVIIRRIDRGGFTVKWGDKEISVAEAADQLRRAVGDLTEEVLRRDSSGERIDTSRRSRRILWVDDRPANNAYEMAQLRERGMTIVEATSTDDALRAISTMSEPFDVVITDMGREEHGRYNPTAGMDLIRAIRSLPSAMPVYVYSTAKTARERGDEVRSAGGQIITSSPLSLFEAIGATE